MHFDQLRLLSFSPLPALMRETVEIRRSSNAQRSCCASHEEFETRWVERNIPQNPQMSAIERHVFFLCLLQSIALPSHRQFLQIQEASVIRKDFSVPPAISSQSPLPASAWSEKVWQCWKRIAMRLSRRFDGSELKPVLPPQIRTICKANANRYEDPMCSHHCCS